MDGIRSKNDLRKVLSRRRRELAGTEKSVRDRCIVEAIAASGAFRRADRVWLYAADGCEPDLSALMSRPESRGKRFFLPRYRPDDDAYEMVEVRDLAGETCRGRYGIPEPLPELPAAGKGEAGKGEAVKGGAGRTEERGADGFVCRLIPAVGCDLAGHRLGRGKGYYDRLLAGESGGASIGVLYECQLAEAIPHEEHDRKLDGLATESRFVMFNQETEVK